MSRHPRAFRSAPRLAALAAGASLLGGGEQQLHACQVLIGTADHVAIAG